MSQTIADLKPTPSFSVSDGIAHIDAKHLELLIDERNQYYGDIIFTTDKIKQLLTDLGLINKDGEFEFKMSALTRSLQTVIFQPSKAQKKFEYLGELQDIVVRYGAINSTEEPVNTNQPVL